MEDLSRCKVCGYVMPTNKIPAVCPACGVDKKVFEPYTQKMSEARYKLLSLHMHPIILHFPQAFVITALGLLVLLLIPGMLFVKEIMSVIQFNILFLPLTVVMGALTGMKDGQLRFKKISTPLLKFKILLSGLFFFLSLVATAVLFLMPFNLTTHLLLLAILGVSSAVAVVLGRAGASLMDSFMPGK